MKKKCSLLLLTFLAFIPMILPLSCGSGDTIIAPPTSLDQVDAVITIRQETGAANADVVASFTGFAGLTYQLKNDQSVSVNTQPLAGPDDNNHYTRTIQATSDYLVTATDLAKFVKTTTIAPPPAFDITSPALSAPVSLSGFTLTWSNKDPNLQVRFTLRQTLNGNEKRKTIGPFPDTGSQTFGVADLAADFFYGKNVTLSITVTKIRERQSINGFATGTLDAELSNTLVVTPGP